MRIQKLLLVTGNPGKAEEFNKLVNLKDLILAHKSLDLEEIQSDDIKEIGWSKTKTALSKMSESSGYDAILTDDTGLYCESLNGLPGPLIKWFLQKLGADGLQNLVANKNPNSRAVCLLSLGLIKTGEIIQFVGEVNGRLVPPRGKGGFGWDIIFLPNGNTKTYGEMEPEEKNQISHRTLAVQQFRDWLLADNF